MGGNVKIFERQKKYNLEKEKNLVPEKAVILAAGIGNRIKEYSNGYPKSLLRVCGREILYRNIRILKELGVKEFLIITNRKNLPYIKDFLKKYRINAKVVINEFPERENGYSFYLAKDYIEEKFLLLMGDHIYERDFIKKAVKGDGLIVDREGRYIDKEEATKVMVEDGVVSDIGKNLKNYIGFDTGFFILTPDIFRYAEEVERKRDKVYMSEIVKKAKIPYTFLSGYFWMDVDTPKDLKRAQKFLIKNSIKETGDGFISRVLNRKISLRISELLINKITPNQASLFSFFIGILSSIFLFKSYILGGLFYQISSVLDGIDGEIARASMKESKFGGYFDSILDRVVDFAFLSVLAYRLNPDVQFLPVVFLSLFGIIMVSYVSERFKGAYFKDIYSEIPYLKYIPGKRDERIFFIFVMLLMGFIPHIFVVLAVVTNIRVFLTLYLVWEKEKRQVI
jgi:CDP-L-myo-inositol myo-inositolphosphotransferase